MFGRVLCTFFSMTPHEELLETRVQDADPTDGAESEDQDSIQPVKEKDDDSSSAKSRAGH